ncbi:hypothetical protein J6590_030399 [Homalodisca vitripennis]|nr:hypothetical protein J6590_030399 [Homalodisca vitripennis]
MCPNMQIDNRETASETRHVASQRQPVVLSCGAAIWEPSGGEIGRRLPKLRGLVLAVYLLLSGRGGSVRSTDILDFYRTSTRGPKSSFRYFVTSRSPRYLCVLLYRLVKSRKLECMSVRAAIP